MSVGDVYQSNIWTRYQDNDNVFTFCVEVDPELDPDSACLDINIWAVATVVPLLKPLHNDRVTFRCSTCRQMWPTKSLEQVADLSDLPGTRVGVDYIPGQLSDVAQIVSDVTDPTARNRGRDFWYGMMLGDMDALSEEWDPAFQSELCGFYTVLTRSFTGATGNGYTWGVFSGTQAAENVDPQFVSNGGVIPDPPTFGNAPFRTVEMVRMNPMIRTQRRRQPLNPCAAYLDCPVPA